MFWPSQVYREGIKSLCRKAVLVTSSAMPGFFVPLATGATSALKMTAKALSARPVGTLCVGLAAQSERVKLSPATILRAQKLGARLA